MLFIWRLHLSEGGEKVNFEEVYQAYFQDVYFYTKSLVADKDLAEEIPQETLFKALKSFHQFLHAMEEPYKEVFSPRTDPLFDKISTCKITLINFLKSSSYKQSIRLIVNRLFFYRLF